MENNPTIKTKIRTMAKKKRHLGAYNRPMITISRIEDIGFKCTWAGQGDGQTYELGAHILHNNFDMFGGWQYCFGRTNTINGYKTIFFIDELIDLINPHGLPKENFLKINQTTMILQARTENSEMFIAMYETEEPKYINTGRGIGKTIFMKHYKKWQSSKREYKVIESDREAIKQELLGEVPFMLSDIETELEKGIDCTFLKNRLKLVCEFCKMTPENHKTHIGCQRYADPIYHWTLLPSEDKKENEAVEKKDFEKTCDHLSFLRWLENKTYFNGGKLQLYKGNERGEALVQKYLETITFKCLGCKHELPHYFCEKTENYCYMCDPNISLSNLLGNKPNIQEPE